MSGRACRGVVLLEAMMAIGLLAMAGTAILVLAAATFTEKVDSLQQAHELLEKVWGTGLASILFAVALLASGQSSTVTGTLAGQVVMEGFVRLRLQPWVRRLTTRLAAIVPALLALSLASYSGTETVDQRLFELLVLSQVILGLQLPFAPLCRPDCAGLCERCGGDRNLGECSCEQEIDARWAPLQGFSEN